LGQPREPAPDGEGFVVNLGHPHAINGHTAFFDALMALSSSYWNWFYWYPVNRGIFLADGRDKLLVARDGWNAGQMAIEQIGTDPDNAANHHGQVALRAHLADDRYAIFLFTPRLRWRNAGDGAWDDETNWTLSLAPAAVHPVVIDRRVVVRGPAAPTRVASLTLAGRARLDLDPAGPLTVAGDVSLGPGTTLSLPLTARAPLAVGGRAALAGTLRLTLGDGVVPQPGDRYPLLTATTITGGFRRIEPPRPDLTITLERTATGVDAVVGP
ncbi:MAG: hypothetical protein D6739_00455, partial [Nitrospirae bacterium]